MANGRLITSESSDPAPSQSRAGWSKQAVRISLYAQLLLIDCAALFISFFVASRFLGEPWLSPTGAGLGYLVTPIYAMIAVNRNAYSVNVFISQSENLRRALGALFVTMLLVLMLGFFVKADLLVSRFVFASAVLVSATLLVICRYAFHAIVARRFDGSITDDLLIVDGVAFNDRGHRYVVDACAEGLEPDLQNPRMLSRLAEIVHSFDRVVVACPIEKQMSWSLFLKGADVIGELVMPQGNQVGAIGISSFHDCDTIIVSRGPLSFTNRVKKRAFDLALTVPALIFLMPLMLVVAIAIRIESPGPVFFKQRRVGQGNRMFDILKFRSMRVEMSDADGAVSTQRDDARITRVGRIIRKTSIDELPQLINVLRSDMSLIGPRPHALGSLAGDKLFWEVNERYWLRHALKPGITGLAQVRGFRGATHRQEDLEDRLQSDLEYLNGWRLWRDITILFGTLKVLVHPHAY